MGPEVPSCTIPDTQAWTFHPAPSPGDAYSWYSVITKRVIYSQPGKEELQILLGSSSLSLTLQLLHHQPLANPQPPGSSPLSTHPLHVSATHPGLASCPTKHPELDVSGSVGSGAASTASALCLNSTRGHAEPPSCSNAPPSPPIVWTASYSLQVGNIPFA